MNETNLISLADWYDSLSRTSNLNRDLSKAEFASMICKSY